MSSPRLERLKQLVAKNPEGAFARYGLAMEYKSLRQWDRAVRTFEELFARHPGYIPGFLHFGSVLLERGLPEEAAAVFRRGIQACQDPADLHAREELEQALSQLD